MVKQCKLKAQLQITERVKSLEIQQVQTVSLYLNQMTNSQLCLSLPSPICSVTGCHARALQSTTSLSPAPLCTSVHNFQSVPFLSVSSIRLKVAFGRPLGFLLSSGALPASTGHFVPGVCDVSTSLRRHARALQSTSSLSPAPLCTSVHNFQSAPFLSVSSIRLKVAFGRPPSFYWSFRSRRVRCFYFFTAFVRYSFQSS